MMSQVLMMVIMITMNPVHKTSDFLILSPVYSLGIGGFCKAMPWLNFILYWLGVFERDMTSVNLITLKSTHYSSQIIIHVHIAFCGTWQSFIQEPLLLKNSSPDANSWRLEIDGNSPTHCASFWGFFRMAMTGEFLISSLTYSTSDGTKHKGKGKHFPCSIRFILSKRHRMRARRLLAGSFFIFLLNWDQFFEELIPCTHILVAKMANGLVTKRLRQPTGKRSDFPRRSDQGRMVPKRKRLFCPQPWCREVQKCPDVSV